LTGADWQGVESKLVIVVGYRSKAKG